MGRLTAVDAVALPILCAVIGYYLGARRSAPAAQTARWAREDEDERAGRAAVARGVEETRERLRLLEERLAALDTLLRGGGLAAREDSQAGDQPASPAHTEPAPRGTETDTEADAEADGSDGR